MKNALFFGMQGFLLLVLAVIFIGCDVTTLEEARDAGTPVITSITGSTILPGGIGTLTVAASANDVGGVLEYQWYSFTETDEYTNHYGQPIAGAIGSTYSATFVLEGSYSFYVVVSNVNNNVSGLRKVSAKSTPVYVNVNDPRNAAYPEIKLQPEGTTTVRFARYIENLPVLEILGESSDGGEISYQWYSSSTARVEDAVEIPSATAESFTPVPTEPGVFYYFVKVTNTNYTVFGRRTSSIMSTPALVNVIANPRAVAPIISRQPGGAIYFENDTVLPITVEADSDDGGVLRYQWQVLDTAGATPLYVDVDTADGAVSQGGRAFTPAISTASISTTQRTSYRVQITNFAEHATEQQEAAIFSNPAEIVLTLPGVDDANLTIAIGDLTGDYSNAAQRSSSPKNQFIRGYGVMDCAWGNFPNLTMTDVQNMYDQTDRYGHKLGFNVLRNMILPHEEDPVKMLYDFTGTEAGKLFYDTVRYVNQQGGYVLSSPWSPPAVWKSNNSTIGTSGKLRDIYYRQYANYLRTFAQAMANNGAPIYTISIQNEPNHEANYDGCNWTPNDMMDFFVRVGYFTQAGVSGTDGINWATNIPGYGGGRALPYVLAMSGSSANNPNIHNAALNNPLSKKNIAIVSRHPYGSRNINLAAQGADSAGNHNAIYNDDPREVWQTEFNLNTVSNYALDSEYEYLWAVANSIDLQIRNNHENVYVWWAGKRFYSMIGDGEYQTVAGQILPRAWAMSHFAKVTNETYHVGTVISGTMTNSTGGTVTVNANVSGGNLNPLNYVNLGAGQHGGSADASEVIAPKVLASIKLKNKNYGTGRPMPDPFYVNLNDWNGNVDDIESINFVMFTPTTNSGTSGFNLGKVKLALPTGFEIRGGEAMRSRKTSGKDIYPVWETVDVSSDRESAFVNLPVGQLLSVRLYNK